MSERAVVLVNPAARRAALADDRTLLATLGARWTLDVVRPTSRDDTTRLARTAADEGVGVVFAAGGDGTAAAVARGLVGTDTAMGLLPLGTANDLARALGIGRTPRETAARLVRAAPRAIDVVTVGDAVCCTVGGLGVVSDSAMAAARLKTGAGMTSRLTRALGGAIYRATATSALFTRRPLSERVEIDVTTPAGDSRSLALDSPGLFVANQRLCGGGIALPGVAADDDGVFELLVVQDVSRARLVDAFARLTLGRPISASVLAVIPAIAARIRTARDESFLGDGDSLGVGRAFDVGVRQRALHVLT